MMSKMISRRVFLKATGLAVLSATAVGALAGCGGGGSSIAIPDAPTMSNNFEPMDTFKINMSALKTWEYNGSYYLYAILRITENTLSTFTITTNDFTCTVGGSSVDVYSLGHVAAAGAPFANYNVNTETASIPLYIKVPRQQCTTDVPVQIVFKHNNQRMTFDFEPNKSYPELTPSTIS